MNKETPEEEPESVIDSSWPFDMQVANNSKIKLAEKLGDGGVMLGARAMAAVGAQAEFVAANIAQAHALKSAVILRAGDPPQYNKERSPKSGVNLSKTSKQGFFKGALSEELRFARLSDSSEPLPHNAKDAAHLKLEPTDPDYQHSMQLDINMQDILREVGPQGDLEVLGYDDHTGLLRLAYKDNHGPKTDREPPDGFKGQFVINLKAGNDSPQFYSREWDKPENDPAWDPAQKIIKKPPGLDAIPDAVYEQVFRHKFYVGYTEARTAEVNIKEVQQAKVFANRPRNAEDFRAVMGKDHPHFDLIKDCTSLSAILKTIKESLPAEEAKALILHVYDKGGSIVAGDWDGMALGHPPDLEPQFKEVINVFAPGPAGLENQAKLLARSDAYLEKVKTAAIEKQASGEPITAFEQKALSLPSITAIASHFAVERAGCITAHEFVFQQVLNHAYRDEHNVHYGEQYDAHLVQGVFDNLLPLKANSPDELRVLAQQLLKVELEAAETYMVSEMQGKLVEHILSHLERAKKMEASSYQLPHLTHDMNVHDLYQHGFDMRNPYGSNLEGAWLLVAEDGGIIYGEKQEQLVEVLLTGDFLKKNLIEVSHGADMAAGWHKVVAKQIELNQTIPPQTLEKYQLYKLEQQSKAEMDKAVEVKGEAPLQANPSHIEKAKSMKAQMDAYRETATAKPGLSESQPKAEAQQSEVTTCKFAQFREHMDTMRASASAAPSDLQQVTDTQPDAESDVAYSC